MLRRVAASMYWLNRYVERAENVARFVDVNLNLMLDCPNTTAQQWQPLVVTTGSLQFFQERYGEATAENVIQFLTFDHNPYAIVTCLHLAREQARSIRQFISEEMWQQINELHLEVTATDPGQSLAGLQEFLATVKSASYLFAGVMDATMSHNEGWHFGQMGRFLERAKQTNRILAAKYFVLSSTENVGNMLNEISWMALLKSVSAYEMYRKGGRYQINPTRVAEFLILDQEFPRSIRFCLQQAEKSLRQIIGNSTDWSHPAQILGGLCSGLTDLTVDDIVQSGTHQFLDDLQQQVNSADDKIVETFSSVGVRTSFFTSTQLK